MSGTFCRRLALLAAILCCPLALAAEDTPAGIEADQLRYERLLRANPFDPAALNNLGVVKAMQGELNDARDLFDRAARLAPDSVEIRKNIEGLGAWQRGEADGLPRAAETSKLPPNPPALWNASPRQ